MASFTLDDEKSDHESNSSSSSDSENDISSSDNDEQSNDAGEMLKWKWKKGTTTGQKRTKQSTTMKLNNKSRVWLPVVPSIALESSSTLVISNPTLPKPKPKKSNAAMKPVTIKKISDYKKE